MSLRSWDKAGNISGPLAATNAITSANDIGAMKKKEASHDMSGFR